MKHFIQIAIFLVFSAWFLVSCGKGSSSPTLSLVTFNGPNPVTQGVCSTAFTVRFFDENNAAFNVTANSRVTSVGLALGGMIYSDSGCTVSIDAPVVTAGNSTGTFYVKGTGTGTVSASSQIVLAGSQQWFGLPNSFSLTIN